jgi:hypothetical protein
MLPFRPFAPVVAACVAMAAPMAAYAAPTAYTAMTIAITQVKGEDSTIADAIYDAFRNKVIAMGRFTVLERDDSRMTQVIKEAAFGESGLVNKAGAPQIGQLLGAGFLTFIEYSNHSVSYEAPAKKGERGKYRARLTVTARFVNTETGVALNAFTTTGSGTDADRDEAIGDAIDDAVDDMVLSTREIFALKAGVLGRNGNMAMIDLGSQHGVKDKTYFNVFRDEDGFRKKIGLVRVDEVGAAKSMARIKDGFWQIKPGDQLEENARASGPMAIGAFYERVGVSGGQASAFRPGAPTLTNGNLFGVQLKGPEMFGDMGGLTFAGGYLPIGNGVDATLFDLLGTFRWDFVPEILALDLRVGPSLGVMGQSRSNFGLPSGASATGENLTAFGFGGVAGANLVFMLGRNAKLFAGAGYRVANFGSSWSAGTAKEKNLVDIAGTDSNAVYPSIGIGGLTITAGIDGQF